MAERRLIDGTSFPVEAMAFCHFRYTLAGQMIRHFRYKQLPIRQKTNSHKFQVHVHQRLSFTSKTYVSRDGWYVIFSTSHAVSSFPIHSRVTDGTSFPLQTTPNSLQNEFTG